MLLHRFIPGYAGNAPDSVISWVAPAVYPRLRGERNGGKCGRCSCTGLSPATRGTPEFFQLGLQCLRFIPGYAGNAATWPDSFMCLAVYPRLRGERRLLALLPAAGGGLSPATRGTRSAGFEHWRRRRFIPGYAGNAFTIIRNKKPLAVYPRLRGERIAV